MSQEFEESKFKFKNCPKMKWSSERGQNMPKLIITKINPLRLLLFNFLHGYCSGISIEKKYFMKFKRGHM